MADGHSQPVDFEEIAWETVQLWANGCFVLPEDDFERRLGLLVAAIAGALFEVRKTALAECRQVYKSLN